MKNAPYSESFITFTHKQLRVQGVIFGGTCEYPAGAHLAHPHLYLAAQRRSPHGGSVAAHRFPAPFQFIWQPNLVTACKSY